MATSSANANGDGQSAGRVVQIIGPVVDVEFPEKHLPPIYQALRIVSEGFDVPTPIDVIAEVQQHLGEGRVRTVSMLPTNGIPSIVTRPHLKSNRPSCRCLRRASRSSILFNRLCAAARLVCSAAPALARPLS